REGGGKLYSAGPEYTGRRSTLTPASRLQLSQRKGASGVHMHDSRLADFNVERIAHWDRIAREARPASVPGREYHGRLKTVYRFLVPQGLRVLDIGCGNGDLLAALQPAHGVGVDFSPEAVRIAASRHPQLQFIEADAH